MKRSYPHLPKWLEKEIANQNWIAVGHWIEYAGKKPDIANFNPSSMCQEGRSDKQICEMAKLCAAAPAMYAALMAMTTSFHDSVKKDEHTQQAMDYALNAMAIAVREKP